MALCPKSVNIVKDLQYKIITSYRIQSLMGNIGEYKGYIVVADRFMRDDVLYIFGEGKSNLVITNIMDSHALRVFNKLDGFIAEHLAPGQEDSQGNHGI